MSLIMRCSPFRIGPKDTTLIEYQVVLANGSVVDANAQSNPDLWWALKGGSNNFGEHGIIQGFQNTYHGPSRHHHRVPPLHLPHPRGVGRDQELHARRPACAFLRRDRVSVKSKQGPICKFHDAGIHYQRHRRRSYEHGVPQARSIAPGLQPFLLHPND